MKRSTSNNRDIILIEQIEPRIQWIRGQRVILDVDLAELYGTNTKAFNQAVKRNYERFPSDFMFQLTAEEAEVMRSQNVTAPKRNIRFLPKAFTEHGALMAASILNTPRATQVSVYVIKAFVKLRELLSSHKELAGKVAELERKVATHDTSIQSLVAAIRRLLETAPPPPPRRQIGFHAKLEE